MSTSPVPSPAVGTGDDRGGGGHVRVGVQPGTHDNCTKLNKKWPHGLGTLTARDKTSGAPVTTFYRNKKAYWAAERHNGTLDRDNDRIACEKR